jgi:hypothetical protein
MADGKGSSPVFARQPPNDPVVGAPGPYCIKGHRLTSTKRSVWRLKRQELDTAFTAPQLAPLVVGFGFLHLPWYMNEQEICSAFGACD